MERLNRVESKMSWLITNLLSSYLLSHVECSLENIFTCHKRISTILSKWSLASGKRLAIHKWTLLIRNHYMYCSSLVSKRYFAAHECKLVSRLYFTNSFCLLHIYLFAIGADLKRSISHHGKICESLTYGAYGIQCHYKT